MGQVKLLDELEQEEALKLMVCEAEKKREIELLDEKIEALERDWLESQSKKYTEILSQYGLTFDELDDEEKYQLIAHEATSEEIAINRDLIDKDTLEPFNDDEFVILEALENIDFSSKKIA